MAPLTDTLRILLIDDDSSVIFALKLLMKAIGYEVTDTTDPAHGLEMMQTDTFDVVVSDLKMPGMTGMEVLKNAKHRFPLVPFIIMSAHATEHDKNQARSLGVDAFLSKPFSPEELNEALLQAGFKEEQLKTRLPG